MTIKHLKMYLVILFIIVSTAIIYLNLTHPLIIKLEDIPAQIIRGKQ